MPTKLQGQEARKVLPLKKKNLKQEESARERALCQLTECF